MTEETIFLEALKKAPAERIAYLNDVCMGNPALRKRMVELLAAHDVPNFLDSPACASVGKTEEIASQDASRRIAKEKQQKKEVFAALGPARRPEFLGSLAHYDVMEVAGRGGMGIVFKARDTKLQRIVAIKLLAPQLAADGTARQRFIREAQAAAAIRDQHVVSIHEVNDDGIVPYLVMEFIGGVTLEEQIKAKGPLAVKEVLRIGMQAAEGLAAAHRQGLIHRDVKPANILLENGVQRVKITDFGLARLGDNASLTQTGVIAGTPLYMSPEQASAGKLDHRTDLFSLGSVLYTLCTGMTAFGAPNSMAVLKRICDDTPRPIRDINLDIPDWLAAIVDKLMSKDPAARYQTAAEVAELFGEHLAQLNSSGPSVLKPPAEPQKRKRRPLIWAAGSLTCVGLAALLIFIATVGWPNLGGNGKDIAGADKKPNPAPGSKIIPLPPDDPRILTVSQKPEDGGQFRTINAALEKAESGMTIRVRDDAVYQEQVKIDQSDQYRGITLEAAAGKKPTIRIPAGENFGVQVVRVENFTLRGFRIDVDRRKQTLPFGLLLIIGKTAGTALDRLDLDAECAATKGQGCISAFNIPLSQDEAPIVIENSVFRGAADAVFLQGRVARPPWNEPRPVSNMIIRNNDFTECHNGIVLAGAVQRILAVGNRIMGGELDAVSLRELLPDANDVLIANNTLFECSAALRVWDEDNAGLKAKNIRFQNNLVLAPMIRGDLFFLDHPRNVFDGKEKPGDVPKLLDAWRFSHNSREIAPPGPKDSRFWIPPGPKDVLKKPIIVMSRKPADVADFLHPPKDSPLGTAGINDALLPAYVGAFPPEGVPEWNWNWTWDALARKLLTVSKDPKDCGRFRTINDALAKVEPGMTIRVLDEAVYEEQIKINRPDQYRGLVLEAAAGKRPKLRVPKDAHLAPPNRFCVWIDGVSNVTLRGLRIDAAKTDQVELTGAVSGTLLEDLDFFSPQDGGLCVRISDLRLATGAPSVRIQNCKLRSSSFVGIFVQARKFDAKLDKPSPCANVMICNNDFIDSHQGVALAGAPQRCLVAGNRFVECNAGVDISELLPGAENVLVANNTFIRNYRSLRVWDQCNVGLKSSKNIRFQNNLVLKPRLLGDLFFYNHTRGVFENDEKPGDIKGLLNSKEWHFSHNWREISPPKGKDVDARSWIPGPKDTLQEEIVVQSRTPSDANFLRPKDPELGRSGAGDDDPALPLPKYVGAFPPKGENAWPWDKTWAALKGTAK
jgi:serine/threonine protein kinase